MIELLEPLLDPARRTWWPALVAAAVIAALVAPDKLLDRRIWLHRSAILDYQLLLVRQLVRWAGLVPWSLSALAVAATLVRTLDAGFGVPAPPDWPAWLVTVAYTGALFVASDASRYALHRLVHRVPALWELHQVHHSAEVLTPATFYRVHPLEAFAFATRGALVTGTVVGAFFWGFRGTAVPWQMFGVSAVGLLFGVVFGNLRHSHVWVSFGPRLEGWFISPAQHQLHHAEGHDVNYGAYLAIWDRIFGSLQRAGTRRELAFGLRDQPLNHRPDDLLSVLIGPLRGLVPRRAAMGTALALLLIAGAAVADDEAPEDPPADDDGDDDEAPPPPPEEEPTPAPEGESNGVTESLEVYGERPRLPRVGGSAHKVEEAQLEQYEHDDIGAVLAPVPGVYVRSEDGYGLRPNIGLRGASADRSAKVTLTEDGVLLAPAPYAAPAAYYFPLTTRMVGVEVFKGPASIQYGPNTIGGAVNLQTRRVPEQLNGALDVAAGMDRTIKIHGWGGTSWGWGGAMLEAVHLTTDGFKRLDSGGSTGFDKSELMFKFRVQPSLTGPVQTAWQLKLGYATERSRETYLGLSLEDAEATPTRRYVSSSLGLMSWNRTQAELAWTLRAGEAFEFRAVGYHHWMDRSWTKLNDFAGDTSVAEVLANPTAGANAVYYRVLTGEADSASADEELLIGTNRRAYHSFGVAADASWNHRTDVLRHELSFGVRLHGDRVRRDHSQVPYAMIGGALTETDAEVEITRDDDAYATAFAAHIHEDLGFGPVRLLPGVRLEVIHTATADDVTGPGASADRAVVLPGFGVHVQPTPWLSLLGGVHRGFSPVAPGQSEDVKPESSWNYEGGVRISSRGFHAEAIGFFNDYSNLSGTCTQSVGCDDAMQGTQVNAGRVHVWGAEATARQEVRLPARLRLLGALTYTYTGSRFRTGFVSTSPQFGSVSVGDRLPYVPEHRGTASLSFDFVIGTVGANLSARSAMRDLPSQGVIEDGNRIPETLLLDLAVDVRISRNVALYSTLSNVTNRRQVVSMRPFGARPGRPFHVMVGVKLAGRSDRIGIVEAAASR